MDTAALSAECEVCLEEMAEPRALPCGHMFCKSCLQLLIDDANNIACPKDRKLINVPSGDAADLARNFYLEDLLENLRTTRSTTPKTTCAEHADKQADFFCESCIKSVCAKCVLKHKAHDCFEHSDSRDKCAQRIQQLQTRVSKFQQDVDEEKTAKTSAVEAQVAECQLKVDVAVNKIRNIVKVLNATAERLRNTTSQYRQFLLAAFKLENLDSLQREVAELSDAVLSLSDSGDGLKLESRFEQVSELTQKLESQRGKLVKESVPELSRWFTDGKLTRSLAAIMQNATKLRRNLTNATDDYLSIPQLSASLMGAKTTVQSISRPSTSRCRYVCLKPYVSSTTAANTSLAVTIPAKRAKPAVPAKRARLQQKHLLILAGGKNNTSSMAYDTSLDTWRQVTPLSCARYGTAASLLQGKMVVAGGCDSTNDCLNLVEQYNPETKCWTAMPNLLQSRSCLALACFEQSLFAIGGWNGKILLDSVERYTLDTHHWQRAASLNTKRGGLCSGVLQIGILIVGGFDGSKRLNTCELFGRTTQKWHFTGSLVTARDGASAATLDEKVYVFGGWDGKNYLDSVEEFDSEALKWTVLPVRLSVPRCELAAATVCGRIYVCGGVPKGDLVEVFDASGERISRVAALPKAFRGAAVVNVPVLEDYSTRTAFLC